MSYITPVLTNSSLLFLVKLPTDLIYLVVPSSIIKPKHNISSFFSRERVIVLSLHNLHHQDGCLIILLSLGSKVPGSTPINDKII
jgi:hypothetical protein